MELGLEAAGINAVNPDIVVRELGLQCLDITEDAVLGGAVE